MLNQATGWREFPNTPRAWVLLTRPSAGPWGADIIARSGQVLVGDEAGLTEPLDGYARVNLHAEVYVAAHLALFGRVKNVLDREYETFRTFSEVGKVELAEAPDSSNPRVYGPGEPRRILVGLRAEFAEF